MHHATTIPVPDRTGIAGDCATLFVSLELSRSTWVATSLAPGSRKMSKHMLVGGEFYGIWTVAVLVEAVIMSN